MTEPIKTRVLFSMEIPEGYEDVHPDLLMEDFCSNPMSFKKPEVIYDQLLTTNSISSKLVDQDAEEAAEQYEEQLPYCQSEIVKAHLAGQSIGEKRAEARMTINVHDYSFSKNERGELWITNDIGEGMGLSKESLDKFWREYF